MENTKPSKLKVLYVSNRHDTFYGVGHLSPRRYLEVLASLDLPDNFCCATAAEAGNIFSPRYTGFFIGNKKGVLEK